ncbi:MAG: ComEC/Rec2 family competence protein [Treponema sp.]|jgi:competence protein ComEC|nr:ComEC/Rec2 family competence protein [Treponema sp.]
MVKLSWLYPPVYSALGAALCYYVLAGGGVAGPVLWFGLLLVTLVSLSRVLRTFPAPASGGEKDARLFREISLALAALAVGFSLGFAARLAFPGPPGLGIKEGEIAGLTGRLRDDPRGLAGGRGMAFLDLENAAGKGGLRASAKGEVLVFFPEEAIPRLRTLGRGSRVYIEGAFLPPGKGSAGPVFRAKGVHILEAAPAVERFRTGIRIGVLEKFRPYKWGGLAAALLLGVRDSLETELAASYRDAGCSHVLALSGMHLAVVSAVIAFLLKKKLGLRAAAILGAVFILLYAGLVGPLPSLERAVLMYLLGTLAVLGTFPRRPAGLLALAFVIQLCRNPASGESLSFILSYLALAGILVLEGPLHGLFGGIAPEILSRPLSASIGAFIATAATTAFFFGVLRPVGIVAGLVIVPLTTVFMIFAMAYLAAAFLLPFFAMPLGRVLSFLYGVLSRIADLAGQVPGIEVSKPQAVLIASLLVSAALILAWKRRSEKGNRLAPFAAA